MAKSVTISSIRATDSAGNIRLDTVHRGGLLGPHGVEIQRADVIDVIEAMLHLQPEIAAKIEATAGAIRRRITDV